MMKKQLYIVDHIGVHSGMHYYNSSFKNYLEEINGLHIDVLSNYNENGSFFFHNFYIGNKLFRLFFFTINYFRLFFKVIFSRKSYFILLSYGSVIDAIFLTITLFSKRIFIDVHEVYALQLNSRLIKKILSLLYKWSVKTVIFHSERSEELLNQIGYINKRIYVPHFKYQFPKTYKVEKIGNDILHAVSNDKINILFFGYVTFEKGIDIFLQATNLLPLHIINRLNIIIAGKDFDGAINTVETIHNQSIKRVLRYINDDELVYLFTNIEYVVFPYRQTSQSGVLEMAFYFKKPVLITKIKYFERLISQFPSFGKLMQINDQSIANTLIELVNSHEGEYIKYFSKDDISSFNEKDDIDKFLGNMRKLIYEEEK